MGCASSNAIQEKENTKNINSQNSRNQNKEIVPDNNQTNKNTNTIQNHNIIEKTVSQQEKEQNYDKRQLPGKQEEIDYEKQKIEEKNEDKQVSIPENNLDNNMDGEDKNTLNINIKPQTKVDVVYNTQNDALNPYFNNNKNYQNNNNGFNNNINKNNINNNYNNNKRSNEQFNNQTLAEQIRKQVLNDIAKNMGINTPINNNQDLNEQIRNQVLNNIMNQNNGNYNNKFINMNNNYKRNNVINDHNTYGNHDVINNHDVVIDSHNVVINNHNVINSNNIINNNNVINNNNIINNKYIINKNNDFYGYNQKNNINRNINVNINKNINLNKDINTNDIFGLVNGAMNLALGNRNLSELTNNYKNVNFNINNNKDDDEQEYNEEVRKRREEEEAQRKKIEEENRRKREEEERKQKEEEQKRKKEWMKKSPEQVMKIEEERIKKEEENILSGIKDRIEAQKKYKEDREKQEQMDKEKQDKDEKRWKTYQKLGVQYHSQKEIKLFSEEAMDLVDLPNQYDISPKIKQPYNAGKISKITYDNALKYFNILRFTAGLTHNIGVTEEYNILAQNASLLMKLNNKMAHTGHSRPSGLDKKIYNSGVKGCAESNLANGSFNLIQSILLWASDEDQSNFSRVGHRRWVLNPKMKNTGFGYVDGFSAMYSFDECSPENYVKNVVWPCQNMPIEFFGDNFPWSISTGQNLEKKVKVTITNKTTNKVTTFDRITTDKFSINNEIFGLTGCVIFRPNFKYKDGDSFRVDVNCTNFSVSYDVNFFNLKCPHKRELIGIIQSSCIKQGKLIYFCDKCGIIEEYNPFIPHDEEIISLSKANCKTKGRKKFKCCYCCQTFDEEIGIQPHDYSLNHINSSQTEGTCKDCGKKIKFKHPTTVNVWFQERNSEQYSPIPPTDNPIDSVINMWVEGVNGDKDYNQIIFEFSDPKLLKFQKIMENEINELKVIGKGRVEVTYYPKYNPSLKKSFSLNLG